MALEVRLPKLSDEMTEATISRWLKEVGDTVDKGEPLVEVETEKVIVEVEAPRAGVILAIVAPEQTLVPVDGLLCRIGAPGERAQPADPPADPPAEQPQATAPAPSPPQAAEPPQAPAPSPPQAAAPEAAPTVAAASAAAASNVVAMRQRAPGAAPVAASPLARRVAEELGLDLTTVEGTGIGGKIVMADLQPHLAAVREGPEAGSAGARGEAPASARTTPSQPAAAAVPSAALEATQAQVGGGAEGYADLPHSGLRRTIARRMSEAKGGIPHFYMTTEVDVSAVLALRERLNAALEQGRIGVNDLLLKATALALERVPALNATYGDNGVRRYAGVHLGFATAIDEGLVTPVVRDCHLKSIGRIAREARVLIERARQRTLAADDLQGGTFTLSNLGMYAVVEFAAIINPPQVGILAVAQPVERPVAERGRVVLRQVLRATLSADHRAVDGVTGAQFLTAFKDVLEHPERLML